MAGFTPNEGETLIAQLLHQRIHADRDATLELGLFTGSPGETITESTIAEPTGTGYARIALTADDKTPLCINPLSKFPVTWRDVFAHAALQSDPDQSPCTARGDALQSWAQWFGVDSNGSDEEIQERIRERVTNPGGVSDD